MLNSLLDQARMYSMIWHAWLLDRWMLIPRHGILIVTSISVPALLMGSILHFAHSSHARLLAEQQRRTDLRCLAENVYHEARGEPATGQRAVAEVTLNRLASPRYPDSVCEVVYERRFDSSRRRYVGAFSWTEIKVSRPRGPAWQRAREAALAVYDAQQPALVPEALHYHAITIAPRWSTDRQRLRKIGRHVFYH